MALEPGARFGHFTIEALLGEGGMGQVYRAFDARLERRVALKILHAQPEGTGGAPPGTPGVARILREARAAAALDHPHAVSIFEVGEHEGIPFLAMELCVGTSLRALIGRGDLPAPQRVRWLVDIARALDAAHAAGIVHLDIKPDNVIVRADGAVKVLDFGIARRTDLGAAGAPDLGAAVRIASISASALAGTPAYMAPEQVRGRQVDGRTDQFAWGVVAFELLSGRKPWPADDGVEALLSAIVLEPAPRLRDVAALGRVDPAVERVVLRALEKAPDRRWPTMAAAAAALEAALGAVPFAPPPAPASVPPAGSPGEPWAFPHDAATETIPQLVRPIAPDTPADTPEAPAPTGGALEPAAPAAGPVRALRRLPALALAAALSVLGVAGASFAPPRAPGPPLAAAAPTTLEGLPPPQGCNEAAGAAYASGVHALHEGAWERARARFQRAAEADPDCAAAQMRFVITAHRSAPFAAVREAYSRAQDRRATLSERDRLLLDAFDPLVRRDRGDQRASAERLAALSARFPGDAELAFLASLYSLASDREGGLASAGRAAALDPFYPGAWVAMGNLLSKQAPADEALAVLDHCQRIAPNAVDCVRERLATLRVSGRCPEMEGAARKWIALDPDTLYGYLALAQALAAVGRPAEAVEEALRQRWSRLSAAERQRHEPYERALVAAWTGDFAGAERLARDLDRAAEGDATFDVHLTSTFLLVSVLRETGRDDEAARLAADVMRRKAAWSGRLSSTNMDVSTHFFEPQILFAARHAGAMAPPEGERAAWVAESRAAASLVDESIWSLGVAQFAETQAAAAEALATMPSSLQARARGTARAPLRYSDGFAVRALLLAGRAAEALALARPLAASCIVLEHPFLHTEARLRLGEALEATGDSAGACAAYGDVAARWGQARPRSATAESARAHAEKIGCSR